MLISEIPQYFFSKKNARSFCIAKTLLAFFQQKYPQIWLQSRKTLNELTSETARYANDALNNWTLFNPFLQGNS